MLVGHSQGSFILIDLIKREIDGKPIQSKLVSAILMGTVVPVPKGKDVGGAFQKIPLCHTASQIGCLITFASFRSTVPPPANTLFGRVPEPTMAAACVNPAALAGGSGELHAYLSSDGRTITGTTKPKPWVTPEVAIDTPWVSVPGLLTAKCTSNDNASGYLEVTVNGNPNDPAGRRHRRRHRRRQQCPGQLGPPPGGRQPDDGQPDRYRGSAGKGLRCQEVSLNAH